MAIAPSAAAAAYQALSRVGGQAGAATGASAADGSSFTNFLDGALKDAVSTMKTGETMATRQVTGQADVVSVVNAVNSAELTLDTVVAVRDRVIQAYQSIMNMPI